MQGTNKSENNTSFHFSNELNHCGTLRQRNIQIGRKETEGKEVVFTARLDNELCVLLAYYLKYSRIKALFKCNYHHIRDWDIN